MTSFTKVARLLLILAVGAPAAGAQSRTVGDTAARPISLAEAVRFARRNAPSAVQARGQIRSTHAAVRSAYSSFVPAVSVSLGSAQSEGDRYDPIRDEFVRQSSWQFSNGIGAQVDVFDGGRRFFDLRRARAQADAAEATETVAHYSIALRVKEQYYGVLAARESEQAARAQLQQAQQQLRAATARVSAGAATKSDSLRSAIQVGNAQLALVTAQNDLRFANASLTRLVATPFQVTAMPDSIDPSGVANEVAAAELELDTVALSKLALAGPLVDEAQAQVVAARAAVRAAKTSYLPTVTASYFRGGSATDPNFHWLADSYSYNNTLRFSLNFPLFDQLGREEQVVRANAAEDYADATLRDLRHAARQSLTQWTGELRTAHERIEIQRATVAASEEDLRVQQQRYALGASTLLDVLNSQTTLNQARRDLIRARFDARVATAQIEALIGRDITAIQPVGAP